MKFFTFIAFCFLFLNLSNLGFSSPRSDFKLIDIPIQFDDFDEKKLDCSGLTIHKDHLFILPQYPNLFSSNGTYILAISIKNIQSWLKDRSKPIELKKVIFSTKYFELTIPSFEGFESIVFHNDEVYLTAEASRYQKMKAYLIRGEFLSLEKGIQLLKYREIPMKINLSNMAYEGMTIDGEKINIFYEANGNNLSKEQHYVQYDIEKQTFQFKEFIPIEFRITDATKMEGNRAWLLNYLWNGESDLLKPDLSDEADKNLKTTERILEVSLKNGKYSVINQRYIQESNISSSKSNNWEGIAKIGNDFVVCTDHYPKNRVTYLKSKN